MVMLYHKHSFNYHLRIMVYMRGRVLLRILRRIGRWNADRERVRDAASFGLRGNQDPHVWEVHYRNFLQRGWGYLAASNFVHHCTDGPECPVAYAFSKAEVRQLFARFHDLRLQVAHFPLRRYAAEGNLSGKRAQDDTHRNPEFFSWHITCRRGVEG